MQRITLPVIVVLMLGLAACASTQRFDTSQYDYKSLPTEVARNPGSYAEAAILWGGVIVNSSNTQAGTQIEVLAYPLDSSQEPDPDRNPDGRFLILDERYLETLDYAPGRLLTVGGKMGGTRSGQIGDATYVYPVIIPDRLILWPKAGARSNPQIHIGVGVGTVIHR
jgi:outer membrane lipoprotein